MPLNKSALKRYRIIIQSLKRFDFISKQELIDRIEERIGKTVSGRTIENDIRALRYDEEIECLAPIKYSKREEGYYLSDPTYITPDSILGDENRESLELTLSLLKAHQHLSLVEEAEQTLSMMKSLSKNHRLTGKPLHKFIETEPAVDLKGIDWFQELVDHIQFEHVITIDYKGFQSDQTRSFTIHPYGLKEFNKRWYLIALRDDVDELRVYGLDRIEGIHEDYKHAGFKASPKSIKELFQHIYGISGINEQPEKFHVRIPYPQAYYELTRPIHSSLKIIENTEGESAVIELFVVKNWEIDSWIRSVRGRIIND